MYRQDVAERFPDGAKIGIMHSPTSESCIVTVKCIWDAIKERTCKNPEAYVNVAEADGKETWSSFILHRLQIYSRLMMTLTCSTVNDQSAFV